jgi:hypothetical protein
MFIEFAMGVIVGGIVIGIHSANKYEKVHSNCPYNKNKSSCKNHSYTVNGNSININNGKLVVDGEVVTGGLGQCHVQVTVEGDCKDVTTSNGDVDVMGDVTNNVKTTNGDIEVHKSVGGNVSTTNGDVDCDGSVGGSVSTNMGNINHN